MLLLPSSSLLQVLDAPPARQVATMGPWPAPLSISDEVDDMPNSDVPRGFVCPITQAIMRQPALLLHDATVTPSTYDKEAISQWLAEHRWEAARAGVNYTAAQGLSVLIK
jgi:hypothetical protein